MINTPHQCLIRICKFYAKNKLLENEFDEFSLIKDSI